MSMRAVRWLAPLYRAFFGVEFAVLRAIFVSILATGLIWFSSPTLTGRTEPWDAEGHFYPAALATAGLVSGGLVPRRLWAHFLGSLIGPLAYQALFLEIGPLFLLGAALSLGYSLVFTAAVAAAIGVRAGMHWIQHRRGRGAENGTSTCPDPPKET